MVGAPNDDEFAGRARGLACVVELLRVPHQGRQFGRAAGDRELVLHNRESQRRKRCDLFIRQFQRNYSARCRG
jgi:hypothetical protein